LCFTINSTVYGADKSDIDCLKATRGAETSSTIAKVEDGLSPLPSEELSSRDPEAGQATVASTFWIMGYGAILATAVYNPLIFVSIFAAATIAISLILFWRTHIARMKLDPYGFKTALKVLAASRLLQTPDGFTTDAYVASLIKYFNEREFEITPKRYRCISILKDLAQNGILRRIGRMDHEGGYAYTINAPLLKEYLLRELEFHLYTEIPKRLKHKGLYSLIGRSHDEFGVRHSTTCYGIKTKSDAEWRVINEDAYSNLMVATLGGEPIARYGFGISYEEKTGWGEGVFVDKSFRGFGVGGTIRDVLFDYLAQEGIDIFKIGDTTHPGSGRVKKTQDAQALQETFVRDHPDAIIHVERTKVLKKISAIFIDLTTSNGQSEPARKDTGSWSFIKYISTNTSYQFIE